MRIFTTWFDIYIKKYVMMAFLPLSEEFIFHHERLNSFACTACCAIVMLHNTE